MRRSFKSEHKEQTAIRKESQGNPGELAGTSSPSDALATAAAALAELGAGFILLLELAGARF